jgi:glycine/D-amino acid oxidase-like deaminating enzyme
VVSPGRAVTPRGVVSAPFALRATEGFTPDLKGQHRAVLPMNSSMIATEPLPPETWRKIGWDESEVLGDFAHVYMYAQRTADDRIAFGGRGVPYRFGSRIDSDGRTQERTIATLTALLRDFFPAAADVPIDTEIARLPWVGHRARRWEIEPLRWLAVQGIHAAYRAADRAESSGSTRTSAFAHVFDLISGR